MAQRGAMSQICMRGFVGDSSMTSLVRPGMMARCTCLDCHSTVDTGAKNEHERVRERECPEGPHAVGRKPSFVTSGMRVAACKGFELPRNESSLSPQTRASESVAHSMLVVSTWSTAKPSPGATLSSRREVPPYRSSPATMWSPALASLSTAERAAMPLAKAKDRSAP